MELLFLRGGRVVCNKGGLARVDVADASLDDGELVWQLPPKALARRQTGSKHRGA